MSLLITYGALAALFAIVVALLQALWPLGIPWAYGLTSGAVALGLNLAVYLGLALLPRSAPEQARLDALFAGVGRQTPAREVEPVAA